MDFNLLLIVDGVKLSRKKRNSTIETEGVPQLKLVVEVVDEDISLLSYLPVTVPVKLGSLELCAIWISSLDSFIFSIAILTFGLFSIVLLIDSSIFRAYDLLIIKKTNIILNKIFKIQNLSHAYIVHKMKIHQINIHD